MSISRNILFVSPFFFPELISTGKYNTHLVEALAESGCDVDVMCSHPLYPNWKPEVTAKTLENVRIIRGGQFVSYPRRPLMRRLILEIWMLFFVFRHLLFSRKRYDSIIIVFPPNLVAGLIQLFRSKNTRVIGIVHDIQHVMANTKKTIFRRAVMSGVHVLEGYSYKICNNLIFLSQNQRRAARELYSISEKKTIVRYPFVTLKDGGCEDSLDSIFSCAKKSVVYSGALGEKQAPEKLASLFIRLLEADNETHAFIFSQGIVFDRIKIKYRHERLHYHPLVKEDQLPELIKRSTVQVIPQDIETSDGAFPSKLPNILSAGAKLFCITNKGGELDDVLSDYSRSLLCYTWDDAGKCLLEFLHADTVDLSETDRSILEKFSLSSLVDSIVEVCSQGTNWDSSGSATKGAQGA